MTPEMTTADALLMAAECEVIRAAYATEDPEVIKRTEAMHPPKRCRHVKEAAAKEKAEAEKAEKEAAGKARNAS